MQHFIENSDVNKLEPIVAINYEKVSFRVKEIHDKLNELNRELGEIVLQCSHDNHSIKMIAEKGNVAKLRKICNVCKSQVGYLTQYERKEWSEKN